MNDIIKKDILAVLSELAGILRVKEDSDIIEIKELSNHTIHNASIFQDEDSISVAVLIYSLSKIIERKQKEIDYGRIISMLNSCISNLKNGNDEGFSKSIKSIFDFIRTMDERLKLYIHEVINQAQIKKGCKLCEHGISVARSAEVLGISQWELMHYIGKTTLIEQYSEPVNALKRLKIARSLFS
ncbi:hypothetical protein HYX08_04360 [Candidatus Woesearchaeota archaeon]|nr:hypothetical protein [Candidatus Woesearchaeota archaeon]